MLDTLRAYLEKQGKLTDAQFELIATCFSPRHLERGSFFQQAGDIAKGGAFVVKGCLRSYSIDGKGKEHIIMFAPEDWWIGDLNSGRNKTPSSFFIDAIEPTDFLYFDYTAHDAMIASSPEYIARFLVGLQSYAGAQDRRMVAALSALAEERYRNFLSQYPSLALRIPQHMLASYLGITPETLSRIRNQK